MPKGSFCQPRLRLERTRKLVLAGVALLTPDSGSTFGAFVATK